MELANLDNFQYIWHTWLEPLSIDIMNQADSDFASNCKLTIRPLNDIINNAENFFLAKRTELKEIFYGSDYTDKKIDCRMDFHKLSAIICRTMIEYKIYDFNIDSCTKMTNSMSKLRTNWLVKNALINFRFAFYASVIFLYQSMVYNYSRTDIELCQKLRDLKKLDLYSKDRKTKSSHESFQNCMVLDLAKRDINNKSFDFLLYSTIMYQLEEYNHLMLV